jgi:altronate hydrolase
MAPRVIRLHPDDDVVIAIHDLAVGCDLSEVGILVRDPVPAGHKVAVRAIAAGSTIRRCNQIIGQASRDIAAGSHVHVHNLAMTDVVQDYSIGVDGRATIPVATPATFAGLVRPDGRVATRNYVGIITSVNCSARVARSIADVFRRDIHPDVLADFPNIDGVVALTHGLGCGIDVRSEAMAMIRRTIAGFVAHPNFAAVLVVGLGCEANQIGDILAARGLCVGELLHTISIQDVGGTSHAISRGVELVKSMLPKANAVRRQCVDASHLVVGLQCGGSDGYSGITANPALGAAVDLVVRNGGSAILSETPEIYGAEHLLTRRAASREIGEKLIARIDWWRRYCELNGAELNNNPSAGNKAGGLTTILEKSLGAVAKAGTTRLNGVVGYAEPVTDKGLVFMDSPGFDPVSATGQVASGANLICFTTGRGSAFGCIPSPSLKLSTNTALWRRQADDIDINCGGIVDGEESIEDVGRRIFAMMLDCASGRRSKSEMHGYGADEFVPWQVGVVT